MRIGSIGAFAALAFVLGSCGPGDTAGTDRSDANAGAPANAALPSETAALAAKPVIALVGEGLSLVDPASGSARTLAFGNPRGDTTRLIAGLLGKPTTQGDTPECPAGPASNVDYHGGLRLIFQGDNFVGWETGAQAKGFATASGIAVGSTRKQLAAAYDAKVEESSLGQEFSAGALSGLLDGAGADAKIMHLWAGTVCIFR